MRPMKTLLGAGLIACVLAAAPAAEAQQWGHGQARQEIREKMQQVMELRQCVQKFYAARAAGDRASAAGAANEALRAWQNLPGNVRDRVEAKYPGTGERLQTLIEELDALDVAPDEAAAVGCGSAGVRSITGEHAWAARQGTVQHDGTVAVTGGKRDGAYTIDDTWTRDGNVTTKEGTITGPDGQTAVREATIVREDDTRTRDATITGPDGQTRTAHDVWTKEDGEVHQEGTVTRADGETIEREATYTREGDTVTREGTATTSDGKTRESTDTWTHDGNTVEHEGTTEGPHGTTTREDTWVRDGKTVTRDGTTTRPSGTTIERDDTYVKEGNTVTHDGTRIVDRPDGQPPTCNSAGTVRIGDHNTDRDALMKEWQDKHAAAKDPKALAAEAGKKNRAAQQNYKPSFKDDDDIFGGRPRPKKPVSSHQSGSHGGAAAQGKHEVQHNAPVHSGAGSR